MNRKYPSDAAVAYPADAATRSHNPKGTNRLAVVPKSSTPGSRSEPEPVKATAALALCMLAGGSGI